jgi:putative ABC transport system permease protein
MRTFQRRIAGNQDVGLIQVSVQQGASTEKAQRDIGRLMRERRHLSPSDEDNFNVMDKFNHDKRFILLYASA